MLENYLEREPEGGKVVLLTSSLTQPQYLAMPFQIVQWDTLFRTRPLDPSQWEETTRGCPPAEKPRGSIQQLLQANIDSLRTLEDRPHFRRPEKSEKCLGKLHACDMLKLWVFSAPGLSVSVLCHPDEPFGKLLERARLNFLFRRGLIMRAQDEPGTARLTADNGESFLPESMTLAEYGVHWGSTVQMKYVPKPDEEPKFWEANTEDMVCSYMVKAYEKGYVKAKSKSKPKRKKHRH